MIAYKRIVIIETDCGPIPLSPLQGTPWRLIDGLFRLTCDLELRETNPFGIYSLIAPGDYELDLYPGVIAEVSIGGTVIVGAHGYRSSEAAILSIIDDSRNDARAAFYAVHGTSPADFLSLGKKRSIALIRSLALLLNQVPDYCEARLYSVCQMFQYAFGISVRRYLNV